MGRASRLFRLVPIEIPGSLTLLYRLLYRIDAVAYDRPMCFVVANTEPSVRQMLHCGVEFVHGDVDLK